MKKKLISLGLVTSLVLMFAMFALPVATTFAQAQQNVEGDCASINEANPLQVFLCRIALLLNSAIPVMITLAVVYFIWGVISYVIAAEDDAKTKGRDKMIWGIIGLAVIVSVWGLVNFLKGFVGIGDSNVVNIPCIPGPGITCPQQ